MNKFLVFTTMLSCIMTNSFIVSDVNGASLYKNRLKEEDSDIVTACQRCLSNCDSALRLNIKSRIETLKAYGLDQEWIKKNYWAYAFSYDLQQLSEWKKSLSNLSNLMMMALTDVAPKETLIPDNYGQNRTVLEATYVENDRSYRDDRHALNSTRKKICDAIVKTFRKISDPNKQDNNSEEGKKILGLLNGWLCLETLCSMSYSGEFSYDSPEALNALYNASVTQITEVFCEKLLTSTQDNDWDDISQDLQKYILGQIRQLDESATLTNNTSFEEAFAKYMRHDWDCYLVQTGVICPIKFDHPEYGRVSYLEIVSHKNIDGKVFNRIEKSTSAMKKCIDVMSDDQVDTYGNNALSMTDKYRIMEYDKSKNDMHEKYRSEFEKIRNSKTMVEGSNQKKNQDKVISQMSTVINGDLPKTVESIKGEVKGENSKQTMPSSIQDNSQSKNSGNKSKSLIMKTMFQEKKDDKLLDQPKPVNSVQKQSNGKEEGNNPFNVKLRKIGSTQCQTQGISEDEIKEYILTNWLYFRNPTSNRYKLNKDNFDLYKKAFVKTWYDKHAEEVKKCIDKDLELLNGGKLVKDSKVWTVLSRWRTTRDDRTEKLFAAILGLIESEMELKELNKHVQKKNVKHKGNNNVQKTEVNNSELTLAVKPGSINRLSNEEITAITKKKVVESNSHIVSASALPNVDDVSDDIKLWGLTREVVARAREYASQKLAREYIGYYNRLGNYEAELGRVIVDSVLIDQFYETGFSSTLEKLIGEGKTFVDLVNECDPIASKLAQASRKTIQDYLYMNFLRVEGITNLIIMDYTNQDKPINKDEVADAVTSVGATILDIFDSGSKTPRELRNNPWYVKSVEKLGLGTAN